MRVNKSVHGNNMILIADLKPQDIILVKRRLNAKKMPYWPFLVESSIPTPNGNGFDVILGKYILPDGEFEVLGSHSCATRVVIHTQDGERYLEGAKPLNDNWIVQQQKKVDENIDKLKAEQEWLKTLR